MEFDERKILKFGEKMLWVEKTSESGWKVWFSYLETFSHSKKMDGMSNLEILKLNPLSSQKLKYALTPRILSHSLKLNGENEAHRVEISG